MKKKRGHAYPIHTIEHSNHPLPIFSLSPQKRHPMVYHYSPKTKKKKRRSLRSGVSRRKQLKDIHKIIPFVASRGASVYLEQA
jgi:hypothetical protein